VAKPWQKNLWSPELKSRIQEIQAFLKSYFDPDLINCLPLHVSLLDPRTTDEINERFFLIYHKLFGPLCVTAAQTLERDLSKTEIGFISERLQAYLKEQGL
jgi:hypothetical protein